MFDIKVTADFSSAHNLENYKGKCEKLHGHNWIVEAVFAYKDLDKDGMAVDFRDARAVLKGTLEGLDHSYLNELKILKGMNPTSENIARFIHDEIKKQNAHIRSVAVWENASSCATYTEG